MTRMKGPRHAVIRIEGIGYDPRASKTSHIPEHARRQARKGGDTHPRCNSTIMRVARTAQIRVTNGQRNLDTRVQIYDLCLWVSQLTSDFQAGIKREAAHISQGEDGDQCK